MENKLKHPNDLCLDVESIEALLRANKPTGCAWPDRTPSSTFQFCENGAKVITGEATTKRPTPELLAENSVSELLSWSDHALEGSAARPTRWSMARPATASMPSRGKPPTPGSAPPCMVFRRPASRSAPLQRR